MLKTTFILYPDVNPYKQWMDEILHHFETMTGENYHSFTGAEVLAGAPTPKKEALGGGGGVT